MPEWAAPSGVAQQIHDYWFGPAGDWLQVIDTNYRRWFEKGRDLDEEIRTRFSGNLDAARRGELDDWHDSVIGILALILLLDQFPRHLFRASAAAFSCDARALEICQAGIERGIDEAMSPVQQSFFYLPLQHAEDLAAQDSSIELMERRSREAPPELREYMTNTLDYARRHREIIQRFGRYPHRNALLGRPSTREEQTYLDAGAARFGQ